MLRVTLTDLQAVNPATEVSATIAAVSAGIWSIKYTLPIASEEYIMKVEVQPNGDGPYYQIPGSPFPLICQVTTTDPVNTVISGDGSTDTIAGDPTNFTVTLFDSGNNQRTSGGDQLAVTIVPDAGSPITDIDIYDHEDGTYTVSYVVFDTAELYTVSVTVNADSGNSKQTILTAVSNSTKPNVSTITSVDLSWPTAAAETVIQLEQAYTFLTHLKDAYSNPIKERQLAMITEVEGQG